MLIKRNFQNYVQDIMERKNPHNTKKENRRAKKNRKDTFF